MANSELYISVGELLGVPRVTLSGYMDGWHDQAILGILTGVHDGGANSLVLDVARMNFRGVDGATALIRVLRMLSPELCVHLVASGASKDVLCKADMGSNIRHYSSTDEIAESFGAHEEYLTSRWMASECQDTQLPLAA